MGLGSDMASISGSWLPLEDGLPPAGLAGGGWMEGLHLRALLRHRIWTKIIIGNSIFWNFF